MAACSLAELTEEETLNDNALAALDAIPDECKKMLPQALTQMEAIFSPDSAKRHKFSMRKRGEAEMPLA
ncbi:unnamed protein product [Lampetra planeri]